MKNDDFPGFGSPLYRYDVVTSTQDVAREWADKGAPPGTVVTARAMTAGRGRQGRRWVVPPGANVCLTALCPPVAPGDAWKIALVAGAAVTEALRSVAPAVNARARFPNDVYAQGRKLSGVLVETVPAPGGSFYPLLGIGVNVKAAPLPPDIAARAISLEEASDVACDIVQTEEAIFTLLTDIWRCWRVEGFVTVLNRWKAVADLSLPRVFLLNGVATVSHVTDIAPDGMVALACPPGGLTRISASRILLGDDE